MSDLTHLGLAERAAREGDWAHASNHLGQALLEAPLDLRVHALVSRLASSETDPHETHARVDSTAETPVPAGRVALRTALLAQRKDFAGAFSLLVQLVAAVPGAGLEAWFDRWAADPGLQQVKPLVLLGELTSALRDRDPADPAFPPLLALVHAVANLHPTDVELAFMRVVFARRLDPQASADLALTLHRARPSWRTAVALHGSLRAVGDGAGALAAIEEALRFSPDEVTIKLDRADTLFDQGRHEDALTAYAHIVADAPDHAWAVPSALFLRSLEGDTGADTRLQELARTGNQRARQLTHQFPGLTAPPCNTTELIAKVLAERIADAASSSEPGPATIELRMSGLEPPSAHLAARAELSRLGARCNLVVSSPIARGADTQLWRYTGTEPRPACPEPGGALRSAIETIATTRYAAERWWASAREVVAELEPTVPELLSVMVHPAVAPPGVRSWDWWFRVQVAAALAIVHVDDAASDDAEDDDDESEGPDDEDTASERALFSLARAPHDWTGSAALIAIAHSVTTYSLLRNIDHARAFDLFDELRDAEPERGGSCWNDARDHVRDAFVRAEALRRQGQELLARLELGQRLRGTIKAVTEYGAFIDLGGIDGLLHRTDLATVPALDDPTLGGLAPGQHIAVEVISLDRASGRIGLRSSDPV